MARPSTRARCSWRKISRDGDKFNQTPNVWHVPNPDAGVERSSPCSFDSGMSTSQLDRTGRVYFCLTLFHASVGDHVLLDRYLSQENSSSGRASAGCG